MDTPPPLEPVDESWERALCVVAHPDDLEFGAAAAVARWTDQGKTVAYAMVTSGDYEAAFLMRPTPVEQVREVAAAGENMPPKSTYFFPKLLTGLLFNPLS